MLGAHVRRYDTPRGTVDGRLVRGVGAQRPRRARSPATSTTGRPRLPDALAGLLRRLGDLRPRRRCGTPLQVPRARRRRRLAGEVRPDGVRHRGAAAERVGRHRVDLRVGRRRRGWPQRAERRLARAADERLRGAPRLVAAGAVLPRAGRRARRLRGRRSASPTSSSCRVAEHPFGGSWGYQVTSLLRADVAVRHARTTSATSSTALTRPASA